MSVVSVVIVFDVSNARAEHANRQRPLGVERRELGPICGRALQASIHLGACIDDLPAGDEQGWRAEFWAGSSSRMRG